MANPRVDVMTDRLRKHWRDLGFFFELDDRKEAWTLTASRAGLARFRDLLISYVANPGNAAIGEHEHYGPYGSLVVMTLPEAGFDGEGIHGSLTDLARLASLIEERVAAAKPGSLIRVREEFAPNSPYTLLLDVREDGFDPSSADPEVLRAAT
jgi:hypothetical protein